MAIDNRVNLTPCARRALLIEAKIGWIGASNAVLGLVVAPRYGPVFAAVASAPFSDHTFRRNGGSGSHLRASGGVDVQRVQPSLLLLGAAWPPPTETFQ